MYDDFVTISDTLNGVVALYNLTKKTYTDGLVKIKKNSFSSIKGISRFNKHTGTCNQEQLDRFLKRRMKERKEKVIDLALNNNSWQYFITLTFDDKQLGGVYSHDKALELLTKWINNQKHQNKNMSYMLVSEFHKSGRLHFHGLVSNVEKWNLTPSINAKTKKEIYKDGCKIYNLSNYKLGFTTVSEIKDSRKVSIYLSKYITKEIMNIKNKKTFWYSRDLKKPTVTYHYVESELKEYLKDEELDYYDKFCTIDRSIEVAEYKEQHNLN